MSAQVVAEAIQGAFRSFLYLDKIVHHETMPSKDKIEGTLGLAYSALAQNENPHPADID
jgi:hypothetical protein